MTKKIFKGIFILAFFVIVFLIGIYLRMRYPTTSPFTTVRYYYDQLLHPRVEIKKQVIGFLPYWLIDNAQYIRPNLVSQLIYFSLTAEGDGHLLRVKDGETDPGWRIWNSQRANDLIARAQISGGKFLVTIAIQNTDNIESILNSDEYQQNLIRDVIEQVKQKNLDGVNLDVEYVGIPDDIYRQKFVKFVQIFTKQLRQEKPEIITSIDVFPRSVRKPRLFDIHTIVSFFNYVIVMSYDYYTPTAKSAGPTAPIKGYVEKNYFFDYVTTYDDYKKAVPSEKIIMGVPYYGYDWPVVNGDEPLSPQIEPQNPNDVAILSYARAKEDPLYSDKEKCKFDELAQQPWCWYHDEKERVDRQAWFEDERSIEAKFEFANKNNLQGIAIWALGYDKNYPELWDAIEKKFTTP